MKQPSAERSKALELSSLKRTGEAKASAFESRERIRDGPFRPFGIDFWLALDTIVVYADAASIPKNPWTQLSCIRCAASAPATLRSRSGLPSRECRAVSYLLFKHRKPKGRKT